MDSRQNILDALDALNPSRLTYNEWKDVGMALKAEGFPCSVWDSWSARDSERYHSYECEKKWNTFNGSGVNGGSIVYLAKQYGSYTPSKKWSFDDYLPAVAEEGNYYEEVLSKNSTEEEPWQMAVRYLETLYEKDESVSYVHSASYKEDKDKWVPADAGHVRKVSAIIRDLKKYKNLDEAFGTINPKAGAWIRHNPSTGAKDADVTRFAYVLVESDSMSLEEQKKFLINQKLPIVALIESGGKSIHAIVKVDASNETEFDQRTSFLFDYLAQRQFQIDEANKNPARLSRLPGAMRNGNIQRLLATNIGCTSWLEWIDLVNGVDDNLPPILDFWDQIQDPPQLSPELIGGILREGNKMIITGDSKAGKTCLSQNLAVCIAEGRPWLGKFKCEQGKVLYMNLEVEVASLYHRFIQLYDALDIKLSQANASNIHLWNLRGYALPLDKLADKIIRRCRKQNYKAIVLDPLYKVQQGDENSAEAIIKFCNALDKIAHETGAAIIYDHHHPKGDSGSKKTIDRGAGSGVFARDADAIVDISNLDPGNDAPDLVKELMKQERPMELSFVLRDFKDVEPLKVWFKFPVHYVDNANLLEGCFVEGSREANLGKNPNRKSEDKKRAIVEYAFGVCQEQGFAKLSDMVNYSPVKIDALRKYVNEHGGFQLNHGIVSKNDIGENADNKNM